MRHLPSDKYNVAWFKLAEFVARGEKERALGLYRLLIHSFEDKALAAQLEGDILLSFNDQAAIEKYEIAAEYYKKEGKLTEAALVHEHILLIKPDTDFSLQQLLDLYEQKGNKNRFTDIMLIYAKKLIDAKKFNELVVLLSRIKILTSTLQLKIYENIVINCCKQNINKDIIKPYLSQALDLFTIYADSALNQFLESIKGLREDVYQDACEYLND